MGSKQISNLVTGSVGADRLDRTLSYRWWVFAVLTLLMILRMMKLFRKKRRVRSKSSLNQPVTGCNQLDLC